MTRDQLIDVLRDYPSVCAGFASRDALYAVLPRNPHHGVAPLVQRAALRDAVLRPYGVRRRKFFTDVLQITPDAARWFLTRANGRTDRGWWRGACGVETEINTGKHCIRIREPASFDYRFGHLVDLSARDVLDAYHARRALTDVPYVWP